MPHTELSQPQHLSESEHYAWSLMERYDREIPFLAHPAVQKARRLEPVTGPLPTLPHLSPEELHMIIHDVGNLSFSTQPKDVIASDRTTKLILAIANLTTDQNVSESRRYSYYHLARTVATVHADTLPASLNTPGATIRHEHQTIMDQALELPPHIGRYDLCGVIPKFIADNPPFRDKNSLRSIVVNTDLPASRTIVRADVGIVCRSLRNLLRDVAGHGTVVAPQSREIPALIRLHQANNLAWLSVTNPGELTPEQWHRIGKTYHSTDATREHGWGKVSNSLQHKKMLLAAGMNAKQVQQLLDRQWNPTRIQLPQGVFPAVQWQMGYQLG